MTTHTSPWLLPPLGVQLSYDWLDGVRILAYRPVLMAIPSWVISSIYLLPMFGSNLVPGVGSMVSSTPFVSAFHTVHFDENFAHGISCTRRGCHIHQLSGSENDHTQFIQGRCRPPR